MSMMLNAPTSLVTESRFTTALGPYVPTLDTSLAGYTVVTRYNTKALKAGGTGIRLTLQGPTVEGNVCTISNVTISLAATAIGAKGYDSITTPTPITFGGSTSVVLSRGGQRISDEINFAMNVSAAILIAYNVSGTGTNHASFIGGLTGAATYRKAATTEAASITRTAPYTALGGHSAFLHKLECFSRTAA